MRPMSEFDPARPAFVHDAVNNRMIRWKTEWAESYRKGAKEESAGVVAWEGRRFDGWEEAGRVLDFKPRKNAAGEA